MQVRQPDSDTFQSTRTAAALRQPRAEPGQLRDAYIPNRRVRLASDVASGCAIALLIGLLATAFTWDERAALFDLARSELRVVKLGLGYLAGPILIMVVLPLVLGRSRQVAIAHRFRGRLLLAAALWIAGLAVLFAKVSDLDPAFTVQAGAYVTGALLVVGLLATLLMWPRGLELVKVDRGGAVRRLPDVAADSPSV